MNILQIDSSVTGPGSVSRQLTNQLVNAFVADNANATVTRVDLVANPIAHLDGALLAVMRPAPGTTPVVNDAVGAEVALNEKLVSEFLAADVVVVGAPMYNFSIPSQLKAWIDRIGQAGRTFRYTAAGPEGLAKGKKVVIASSRGGMYAGTAYESVMDHQEAYLRAVFGFFGITDISVIRAEGIAMGPDAKAKALTLAESETTKLLDAVKAGSKVSTAA